MRFCAPLIPILAPDGQKPAKFNTAALRPRWHTQQAEVELPVTRVGSSFVDLWTRIALFSSLYS